MCNMCDNWIALSGNVELNPGPCSLPKTHQLNISISKNFLCDQREGYCTLVLHY